MANAGNPASAGAKPTTAVGRVYYIQDDYTIDDAIKLIESHITNSWVYDYLYGYYKGTQAIQQRAFNDINKPNNKIVTNLCKLVTDTSASFLASEPVTYTSTNKNTLKQIKKVLDDNSSDDVNLEEAKLSAIMGHAFEIHWQDNTGHHFKQVSPQNCFIAYSMDIDAVPLVGFSHRTFKTVEGDTVRRVELYTTTTRRILTYQLASSVTRTLDKKAYTNVKVSEGIKHNMGELPIIEIVANEERLGDFEGAISLQDAYNLAQSDTANDINYWNDAYLHFDGLELTEDDDIEDLKNDRVFVTPPSPVGGGTSIRFITKDVNDKHLENFKVRTMEDFFRITQTADVSGSDFSASSGVAIKYRTQTLENKTSIKEVKFKEAIAKRHRLIAHTINLPKDSSKYLDPTAITAVFTRNLPASLAEISDMIVKLQGIVSNETLLSTLPFVDDVEREIDLVNKEQEQAIMREGGVGVATQATQTDNKLNNDPDKQPTITKTMTPTSAKAKEKAINKAPLNQPKAK